MSAAHTVFRFLLLVMALGGSVAAASADAPRKAQEEPLRTLAGFSYETRVEGAAPDAKHLPVVIGLHWSHSSPAEFGAYLRDLGVPVRIVLVRGRYPTSPGFSFFPVAPRSYYKMSAIEKHRVLGDEAQRFAGFVRGITAAYPAAIKPVIVGASQGGDLSYAIATHYGDLISMAIPLLGTLDAGLIDGGHAVARPPIVAFDGGIDPIVPPASARAYVSGLRKAGYAVSLRIYPKVAHDISDPMRSDLHAQIRCVVRSRPGGVGACRLPDADP